MPSWLLETGPILVLLVVVALVVRSLPKVDMGHTPAFLRRRFFNWFPVGLTYAFLYMGRYNLTVAKDLLGETVMPNEDFGNIFTIGTWVYGLSFVINGPLADRIGGRKTMLISATGAALSNLAMGVALTIFLGATKAGERPVMLFPVFAGLYAINMYFQSFGAVSVVKVNSSWFHLRERGTFGGIFGILISLGYYFAFDWSRAIGERISRPAMFFVPAAILGLFIVPLLLVVRDSPAQAGLTDFETGDAHYEALETGSNFSRVLDVAKRMLRSRAILTIIAIEFCSGFLRNSIQQWYTKYASGVGALVSAGRDAAGNFVAAHGEFVPKNWGMMQCIAGICGGMFAGIISDRLFQSRRGPVSAVLYGGILASALGIWLFIGSPVVGGIAIFMSMCFIGVHGMLSGTASMDFGGKKNVGLAVGIIDGFVYLGTGLQALILGHVLPQKAAAKVIANWWVWPAVMIPAAVIGLILAATLWNAKPKAANAPH